MGNSIDTSTLPENTSTPVDGPKDPVDFIAGVTVETDSTDTEPAAESSN